MANGASAASVNADARAAAASLDETVEGLRVAGSNEFIARGLLARAAFRRAPGDWKIAGRDLDEVEGHCHVAMRRARAVYALRIFRLPRRPRATWSSPRRVARGVIWLT